MRSPAPLLVALAGALGALAVALVWSGRPTRVGPIEPIAAERAGPKTAVPGALGMADPEGAAGLGTATPELAVATDQEAARTVAATEQAAPALPVRRVLARGTLVDERTREALPEYALKLVDSEGVRAGVVTDREGRFEFVSPLVAGRAVAMFEESNAQGETELAIDPADAEHSLALALATTAGPTYTLALAPEGIPAPDKLQSQLTWGRPGRDQTPQARVRAGEPAWVRFAPIASLSRPRGRLEVSSVDGLWIGSTEVVLQHGRVEGIVNVALDSRAVVDVTVVGRDGKALPNALVELNGEGRRGQNQKRTDAQGLVSWRYARAAPYKLRVRAHGHVTDERALTLVAAEAMAVKVELVPLPIAGAIRGQIVSDSGTYERTVAVRLEPRGEQSGLPPLTARVEWQKESGALVGTFQFPDLTAGRWQLSVNEEDWFDWEPKRMQLDSPREDVVLRVHDGLGVSDVAFAVTGPDGTPQPSFSLEITSSGERRTERGSMGLSLLRDVPHEKKLEWRVDAEGCLPIFGTAEAFARQEIVDDRPRRTADLHLERGYGDRFRVVTVDNGKPIAGAEIVFDGRAVAVTDSKGYAFASSFERPSRAEVHVKAWGTTQRIDLTPQNPQNGPRMVSVYVRPPPIQKK